MDKTVLSGFAKFPKKETVYKPFDIQSVKNNVTLIPRGNGKSYGDIAIGDRTIHMLNENKFIHLNEKQETVTCEAGILLHELNSVIHPKGFRLPVIPGTEYITLGGAIANDVHGKNHTKFGSFGHHVISFKLLTENQKIITCSPTENYEYFINTIGGVGLTGIILEATIKLQKQKYNTILAKRKKVKSIAELIQAFEQTNEEYQIAWIKNLNQIVYTEGSYTNKQTPEKTKKRTIKFNLWGFFTSKLSLKLTEKLLYIKSSERHFIENEKKFLHPLDNILGWNKLYPKGFIQFQFLVPKRNIEKAINLTFEYCKQKKQTTFVTTLKKFGSKNSVGNLSFPKEGYAFSIDIKYKKNLPQDLALLANKIIDLEGRFYLAKDAYLNEEHMIKSYPNFLSFKKFVIEKGNGKFVSSFSKRINIHS